MKHDIIMHYSSKIQTAYALCNIILIPWESTALSGLSCDLWKKALKSYNSICTFNKIQIDIEIDLKIRKTDFWTCACNYTFQRSRWTICCYWQSVFCSLWDSWPPRTIPNLKSIPQKSGNCTSVTWLLLSWAS